MHEKYIEPSKEYADVIIPRGGHNKPALHLLEDHIEMLLRRQEEREPQEA
jgi:uridine kinase